MNYPIKSLLFLLGDDEFADSPAGVNRRLFANPDAKWMKLMTTPAGSLVEVNPEPEWARMGTRLLLAVRFTRKTGEQLIQPFYRSSGVATPEVSKKGDWWPCSGLYTSAYCKWRGLEDRFEGHIGKHQFIRGIRKDNGEPFEGWYNHDKDRSKIIKPFQAVCDALAAEPALQPK